jgi:hypothetical protein
MSIATRNLLAGACLALSAAVACGRGAPTRPSEPSGATIAGVVNGGRVTSAAAATGKTAAAAPSGMIVTIVGTNLSGSVDVTGHFAISGVPSGNVQLQFTDGAVSATVQVSNVGNEELIRIEVNVTGTTATIVSEARSTGKIALCHAEGNGSYHLIDVSVSAEPAHRDHGDGAVGDPVPADPTKKFDENCRPVGPEIRVEKSTNGEDADEAPGPKVLVGSTVTWQYVVTNTGNVPLTNVVVTDDKVGAITCGKTTLAVGESMTCTATGTATLGQYTNVATATANWASGVVSDTDVSHYLGEAPEEEEEEEEGQKVALCHRTGNGSYHLISVSISAEPAHRAHGDAKVGEAVPGQPGKVFTASCGVL